MSPEEVDLYNHALILNFLNNTPVSKQCEISGSIKATISQFLMSFRNEITRLAHDNDSNLTVTSLDIVNAQLSQLRECIIDLESLKDRLLTGVTVQ